jgi:hypothetical protein
VSEGFRNDALRAALRAAAAGQRAELDVLLTRYGGLPGQTPNIKLAQAFGVEFAALRDAADRLLAELGDEPAPASSPRAFLPVAATYAWMQRVRDGRNVDAGWNALAELAADSRRPVRFGVVQALREFGSREGAPDAFVERAAVWLEHEEREISFGASATAFDVLSDPRALSLIREHDRLFAYLSSAIDVLTAASRAASRLEGWRRLLAAVPKLCASVVSQLRAESRGADWFAAECERASNPDVRAALSQALLELSNVPRGTVDRLRKTLEASAKPVRDAARVRPGSGRGRRSRPVR